MRGRMVWLAVAVVVMARAMLLRAVPALRRASILVACEATAQQALKKPAVLELAL